MPLKGFAFAARKSPDSALGKEWAEVGFASEAVVGEREARIGRRAASFVDADRYCLTSPDGCGRG